VSAVEDATPVGYGLARLRPDPDRPGGWTLFVDGVEQSYVDLSDPTHLEFGYVRRLACVVDTAAPAGRPLRVLHLGGGALTLPRYVAATRPGSAQVVVERDALLAGLVARRLPLPAGADVRVEIADARAAVDAAGGRSFDLVLGDVYQAAQMPGSVASTEFAAAVARLLTPRGLYAVNVADLPPLAFSRRQAATLRAVFADVGAVGDPGMRRGRRYGNLVLAAARQPGRLPVARLAGAAARDVFRGRLLHGEALDRFVAGALPVTDAAAEGSPRPPAGGLLGPG
jgi:hypothetical protein